MAAMLHMSQSNYSKIENNKVDLRAKTAKEIAAILNLKLEDLIPDDAIVESAVLHEEKLKAHQTSPQESIQQQLDEIKQMVQAIYAKVYQP